MASPRLHTVLHPMGRGPAAPHCPKKTMAHHLGCPTPEGQSNTSLSPALGTWHPGSLPFQGTMSLHCPPPWGHDTPAPCHPWAWETTSQLCVCHRDRTAAVPPLPLPQHGRSSALHCPTRAPHSILGGITKPRTLFFSPGATSQGSPGVVTHKPQAPAGLQPWKPEPPPAHVPAGPQGLWIL